MSKKNQGISGIQPKMQRVIAKMGRKASGAGKTVRATRNSKEINHFARGS